MDKAKKTERDNLESILADLREALGSLDDTVVPADIAAHLSLVIERLEDFIAQRPE